MAVGVFFCNVTRISQESFRASRLSFHTLASGHDHSPLDGISQLPHIAGNSYSLSKASEAEPMPDNLDARAFVKSGRQKPPKPKPVVFPFD